MYKNPDGHMLGPWKSTPLHAKSGTDRSSYTFKNGVVFTPPPGTFRRFNDVSMERMYDNDEIFFGSKGTAVPSRKTFLGSLSAGLVPVTLWLHESVGDNHIGRDEVKSILSSNSQVFDSPKPTTLIGSILQIATDKDSIILDSFAGSGTTAHAVLKQNAEDGGNRKFILVEMEPHIARDITAERVRRVAGGYTNAKGEQVEGLGGGFQYCRLSKEPLFDATGAVREDVTFAQLSEFVWFAETGTGFTGKAKSPLLGVHEGVAVYLLYNGILKDRTVDGGNVLTAPVLALLPPHAGPKVIYAAANRLGAPRLQRERIVFKQTPYALDC
ncbi:MAG: hypothetical protein EAZ84_09280 [Verrucomicrobia bacterium]|nr:MAG: hypothetical protein EAZ84_09280 [Verrucomicrobiota bacterium]TAE85823.1 MAG: hypothetical protein EAZ82_12675 [Verrucomicrobiota bacterium]TAF23351.1 MAG: hypothetical protein EAZ71_12785 [Verrucomicrobiota bacterium]